MGNSFFESAVIKKGQFAKVQFRNFLSFRGAEFNGHILFVRTVFHGPAEFDDSFLNEGCDFVFDDSLFESTASFVSAKIKGFLSFDGGPDHPVFKDGVSLLDFQHIRIQNPELISFHAVRLRPSWFVNTDPKRFVFTACVWRDKSNKDISAREELKSISARGIASPNKRLTKIGWQLADNFEETKSFATASFFRKLANESKRLEEWRGFKIFSLHWWYSVSSFYGESPGLAFCVLIGILALFVIYYWYALFYVCSASGGSCLTRALTLGEAIHQSFMTGAFQEVKFRSTLTFQEDLMILLEKIFVSVQAALFALAIRRRFMR